MGKVWYDDPEAGSAWITTVHGRKVDPFSLDPSQILIDDVAHGLSLMCRWLCQCTTFYSVAQHSLHVASMVKTTHPEWELEALMHDAHEAFMGDVPRPYKRRLPGIRELELHLKTAFIEVFELNGFGDPECRRVIAAADNVALAVECRDLMPQQREWHEWEGMPTPQDIANEPRLHVMSWLHVKTEFLIRFDRLYRGRADVKDFVRQTGRRTT